MRIWPVMAPHSPDLLSSWSQGSNREMVAAFARFRQDLLAKSAEPFDAVIAYTPGWQVRHVTLLDLSPEHQSSRDFSGFGHHYQYDPPGAPDLGNRLILQSKSLGMAAAPGIHGVDHAISVPLFFLLPEGTTPVLPVSQSLSGVLQAMRLGEAIRSLSSKKREKILLLVSGVISMNAKEMARGWADPEIPRWTEGIISSLVGGASPDWSLLPSLGKEVLDTLDPPGRLRELHLLKGLGVSGGQLWAQERIEGLAQVLIGFDPIET